MTGWLRLIRPGDLVVVGQGVGEPTPLLEQVLTMTSVADVEVFVGLSHSAALTRSSAVPLVSFGALGPLGRPPINGRLEVIPAHFDDLSRLLPLRGRDLVLLIQVATPDAQGGHSFGMALDCTYELLGRARTVVAEVNAALPITSAPRVHRSRLDYVYPTSRPLPTLETAELSETYHRIAAHIAQLIPDGATVQLGLGLVAAAAGHALRHHRDLRVRSTLAGDWLLDLENAGALRNDAESIIISEAAGSADLYAFAATASVQFRPVSEVTGPAAAGQIDNFVAVNSALQVDLTGQVNAEELPSGYVGGIGGQAEYLRAAQRSRGGLSIVALPATAGRHSRIVTDLASATVTTARSYIDFVVTEHGVADLRGRSLSERRAALVAIAAPEHRSSLTRRHAS